MSNELKVLPVANRKVQLKTRKRIPYAEILKLLLQGENVFIEVDRKMAYYIKKKLNSLAKGIGVDTLIESYPSIFTEDNGTKLEGYVFKLVKYNEREVNLVDKTALVNEIKKLLKRAEVELDFLEKQPPDKSVTILKKIVKARIETLKEVIEIIERY